MRHTPFRGPGGAAIATIAIGSLTLPLSGCGAEGEDAAATSMSTAEDWRDKIVESPLQATSPSEQAMAAMAQANVALQDHEDVWALNHYTDDGGVVVNLTAGWEAVVGDQVAELKATAPAPVEVRVVEHSHTELMAPALTPIVPETDFADASMISAFVDPELNALVVELTEIDQDSVEAAAQVFGENAVFAQGEQAEATTP